MEPRELYTAMCKLKSAFADAYRAYQKYFKSDIEKDPHFLKYDEFMEIAKYIGKQTNDAEANYFINKYDYD